MERLARIRESNFHEAAKIRANGVMVNSVIGACMLWDSFRVSDLNRLYSGYVDLISENFQDFLCSLGINTNVDWCANSSKIGYE